MSAPGLRAAQQSSADEYELKAAMLYNLMKFVEWPRPARMQEQPASIVCVVGWDPFGGALGSLIANKTVNGRTIEIRRFAKAASQGNLRACDLLYISSSERKNLGRILSGVGEANVLTVGEMNRFAERGGMVQLALENNQVHFEINVDAVSRTGLKVSSKLLALAQIVRDQSKAEGN